VPVETDTSMDAILEHRGGAVSTVSFSFDVWASRRPLFEVYGTNGTIAVPDPNHFGDPVEVFTADAGEWRTVPPSAGYPGAARGAGLADMARAIETDRPHRASGELALHVLEIMAAVTESSTTHQVVPLTTTVDRPEAVPEGADPATW